MAQTQNSSSVVVGGGCFWCIEAIFQQFKGVTGVESGYAGGTKPNPTYDEVSHGNSGHAEVVRVNFDSSQISLRQLLTIFFHAHDPTTKDRQGNDVGPQYRSIILYSDDEQRVTASEVMRAITSEKVWNAPLVTELVPLKAFYLAENYHQNYFNNNGSQPYCSIVIGPKVKKIRTEFASLLKTVGAASSDTPVHLKGIDADKVDWKAKDLNYWKSVLTPEQFQVCRDAGTERPFSGKYCKLFADGDYHCACCGLHLFSAKKKFDSGTGWPSFTEAADPKSVVELTDTSHGMVRTEVRCARCGAHLGHVFDDGPPPTRKRYCINSICLFK